MTSPLPRYRILKSTNQIPLPKLEHLRKIVLGSCLINIFYTFTYIIHTRTPSLPHTIHTVHFCSESYNKTLMHQTKVIPKITANGNTQITMKCRCFPSKVRYTYYTPLHCSIYMKDFEHV